MNKTVDMEISKTSNKKNQKNKYPFITDFVNSMENINASEYVSSNETDLKSLLSFFHIYIVTCRKLKSHNISLSSDNIIPFMEHEFDIWKNYGSQNYIQNNPTLLGRDKIDKLINQ